MRLWDFFTTFAEIFQVNFDRFRDELKNLIFHFRRCDAARKIIWISSCDIHLKRPQSDPHAFRMSCTMTIINTTLFRSNRSQAVRLPKAVELPESVTRVDIVAIGRARLITPAGESWDSWFDGSGVSDDFLSKREQPADQTRESF